MSDQSTPTVIIDTREQTPWTFAELPTVRDTLDTGDYSVVGLRHVIAVISWRVVGMAATDLSGSCKGSERTASDCWLSRQTPGRSKRAR